VTKERAYYIREAIHEGDCGSHAIGQVLTGKVPDAGPTLLKDALHYIKKCDKCHF